MSASANLDLVRSIYAAWERGDYRSVEWGHRDIEYVFADGPDRGGRTGVAEMVEDYRNWLSAWERFCVEPEDYQEVDDERILVLTRWGGRGKTSGLDLGEMHTQGAHLFHIRSNKVTRFVVYFDRDRALADLGLAPETDSNR